MLTKSPMILGLDSLATQLKALALLLLCWTVAANAQEVGHSSSSQTLVQPVFSAGITDMDLSFELVNASGQMVTEQDFRGSHLLVAFGFTYCVDVCPLIAANMANTLDIASKDMRGVFISVDTERDTPETTHTYASHFHEYMTGLSGSYSQVSAAAKTFNTRFVITKSQDSYVVQHSASIFLLSPEGELIDSFAINTAPEQIIAAIQ